MKNIYKLTVLFFIVSCSNSPLSDTEKKDYFNAFLKIIKNNSIRKDSIDLEMIQEKIFSNLDEIKSIEDCHQVVKTTLLELKDNHSFFMDKKEVEKWSSTSSDYRKKDLITFTGKLLDADIGFIKMNGFSCGDSLSCMYYSDSLQGLIKSIDRKNLKGWVLDLRENTGGNCWPMLAGIGSLLGEGVCGFFLDAHENSSSLYYENGVAGMDSTPLVRVSRKPYELYNKNAPVAVLTGENTMSSGEIVAIAFRGKTNAKSFGGSTKGLSTGNTSYFLPDSSVVFLTSAIDADRKGKFYGGKIVPDSLIEERWGNLIRKSDNTVDVAKEWINNF